MEELGLQEDTTDVKQELSDSSNSPESKRRRLMLDSSSSLPDDQDITFGSPEPPIPMPVPDVKKEEEGTGLTGGIVMPTAPPADEATNDKDKPGPSSGGGDKEGRSSHGDGDKETAGGEDAPREEKTKEELAEEERQKMQILVSSFSEEQLNRYEMYRRSSFPKAAIKRTVASDPNSGQKRAESLPTTSQQPPRTASSDTAHAGPGMHMHSPQPATTHAGLSQAQQHTVNHQSSIPLSSSSSTSTSNPNAAALQLALSALQPLLLQQTGVQPALGLHSAQVGVGLPGTVQPGLGLPGAHPTFGLPGMLPGQQPGLGLPLNPLFQAPPTILPFQQLHPGLAQSPYQMSPSTTVFVIPQPLAAQAQPVAETQTSQVHHHQHKNCCPRCVSEIQELRRLVDLVIRANANIINPGFAAATNIAPLLLQQQHATAPVVSAAASSTIGSAQRLNHSASLFSSANQSVGSSETVVVKQELSDLPSLAADAVQERTGLVPDCPTDWQHDIDEGAVDAALSKPEKFLPSSTTSLSQQDCALAGTSYEHSMDQIWKSKRGKNTMEMIQSRLEPDPSNRSQYVIKEEVLWMLRQKSDDRQFIARRLANLLFTKQERRISNCHGRRHKRPLDPVRLDAIKRAVFKINPTTPDNSATREIAWKQCCASIDMSSRSACRNIKQT